MVYFMWAYYLYCDECWMSCNYHSSVYSFSLSLPLIFVGPINLSFPSVRLTSPSALPSLLLLVPHVRPASQRLIAHRQQSTPTLWLYSGRACVFGAQARTTSLRSGVRCTRRSGSRGRCRPRSTSWAPPTSPPTRCCASASPPSSSRSTDTWPARRAANARALRTHLCHLGTNALRIEIDA